MRVLISGGSSKFSKELQLHDTTLELIPVSKKEMDVTDHRSVSKAINRYRPDVFLHTAALSRPMNIHDKNPIKSINLNIIGTSNCVTACIEAKVKFVYISTDYVYAGTKGNYSEEDEILPINKYAWSKLGGEAACMLYDNSLVLRMAMMEKPFPHPKAFSDSFKSCIWYPDAAKTVLDLIQADATGIYNVGSERISIYEFVSKEDVRILEDTRLSVTEDVAADISLNIDKLKNKLNDSVIQYT